MPIYRTKPEPTKVDLTVQIDGELAAEIEKVTALASAQGARYDVTEAVLRAIKADVSRAKTELSGGRKKRVATAAQ